MSDQDNQQIHIDSQDASAGAKRHGVRYVLAISLLAAIIILSAIWMLGAFG